ncbi:DCC-interacting protein 13-alpha-like isoform X1 [Mizuhopecten yessoensis]|uniref:DCC-interacting protein 13-alpha-like isoform X1 n=1 Tax=Mizuhopecten yessoensis TaxID=6573 RepID=UPI000B45CD2F|nr:DCC-interacting protein 13-alpha-like isoform X1 [Mizuhopecten yessoensis]
MPGIEKLHLEDALEDSPQTRHLLSVFEKDALALKKYSTGLHGCCQRIMKAQNELCAATQSLAQHLRDYEIQKFSLETEDSILTSTLKQYASYLDDVSSIQQVLSAQLSETMMYPCTKFLQADLEEVTTLYEMFNIASSEHGSAQSRYMKLSKRREDDRTRNEANQDLYLTRKKFHQTSLHYFSCLNALQYKRKFCLLEPVMGYLHAQRAFFRMGQDAVGKTDIEDFLSNIAASVQGVQHELQMETKKTVDLIDNLEQQSAHQYHGQPPVDMPYIPPNTSLTQKAGYLYIRSKQLLATKWEKCFFFTQAGNLMCQAKAELAGSLVLDLNEPGVMAEPCEADDRRFVFAVVSQKKKSIVVQAENDREKDEWICTINNIVRESGYEKGTRVSSHQPTQQSKKERAGSSSSMTKQASGSVSGSSSPDGQSVSSNASNNNNAMSPTTTSGPAPSPGDVFLPDAPIQFDIITPTDENGTVTTNLPGPPKRINPFDQSATDVLDTLDAAIENASFVESFLVRFLGSMEVKSDRGDSLVHETMRQIMAARAIHNVFRMTESRLVVSSECMRLIDPGTNNVRTQFNLADISFWAAHHENNRLFGFITRTKAPGAAISTFACHVFECNVSAEEICQAIGTATKLAFQAIMERKHQTKQQQVKQKEHALLLANIGQIEDAPEEQEGLGNLPLSSDGKYLVLTTTDESDLYPESQDMEESMAKMSVSSAPPEEIDSESEA